MPQQGQTAVIVPVPEIDFLLLAIAKKYPHVVREGVGAHISLLYPFMPLPQLDDETAEWLSSFSARQIPLRLHFTHTEREPGFVSFPCSPLDSMARALRQRWPHLVPYGGRFGQHPCLHLTLAMRASEHECDDVTALVQQLLPVTVIADQLQVLTFDRQWSLIHSFPFGPRINR